MKIIRFFKSKTFWANLIVAIILIALMLWGTTSALDVYTRHGENIKVPELNRLSYTEAQETLEELELEAVILDSAEFDPNFPRGSVLNQYPDAGSLVKKGREIRLTLNPLKPRKIVLPILIEKTKRRAVYDIESKGFKVGDLEYVPYIGKDVVVDIKVNGKSVKAGDRFEKGTVITLVLGQGLGDSRIKVPYLRWLTKEEADNKLLTYSLNLGAVVYDEEVTDTLAALVYRQYPGPTFKPSISPGQQIDIWLTNDHTKIPNDSLQFLTNEIPDSLNAMQGDSILY